LKPLKKYYLKINEWSAKSTGGLHESFSKMELNMSQTMEGKNKSSQERFKQKRREIQPFFRLPFFKIKR